jgi:hypothetical protein
VTISQSTISYKGWTGAGYSIVDPNTGAGAYLIGGGADGSLAYYIGAFMGFGIMLEIISLTSEAGLTALISGPAGLAVYAAFLISLLLLITSAIITYNLLKNQNDDIAKCFAGGFLNGITAGSIIPIKYLVTLPIVGISVLLNSELDTNNNKYCRKYTPEQD